MPAFRILAAIRDPWSATNICNFTILIKRETFWPGWYANNSVIRDQWFSKIEFSKFFLKICQPLEFLPRSVIRDPLLIFVILLFWLGERFSGLADMLIILWSVIRDQWFSKIEFSKFFLKICQPLEFLPRSLICDPLLIFVLYYSD